MKFNIALHWYLAPHSCTILHLCCIVPCEPAAAGHAGRHIVYRCFPLATGLSSHASDVRPPPHRLNRPAEATRPLSTSVPPLSPTPQQRDEDTSHHTRPRLSQTRLRPAPPPSLFSPPAPTSTKHKLVDYNQRVDDDQGYCQQSLSTFTHAIPHRRSGGPRREKGHHTPHNHPHTGNQVDNLGLHALVRALAEGAIVR